MGRPIQVPQPSPVRFVALRRGRHWIETTSKSTALPCMRRAGTKTCAAATSRRAVEVTSRSASPKVPDGAGAAGQPARLPLAPRKRQKAEAASGAETMGPRHRAGYAAALFR